MTRLPNVPGPGEQNDPDYLQAEAVGGPIPEGEMPGLDGTPFSHLAFEPEDAADLAEGDAPMVQHRAGTDRRVIFAVCAETGQPEARLDGSSNEVPHEAIIDPAQDNAGAQPDPL
ncbi:MAG: hypothetical protein KJ047_10155 [Anaerolineae bacterium]|nr:hypothetical protein [Anaerolineae bacterium]MEB2288758.1 hypothetical protein [Anaerolineae bacterium]